MTDTTDKRVQFDFDIGFSNGGGIQGQGFRLDIDGDDISDDALAAYIIRDLRLLMVGEVRIIDKQIIQQRHKRAAPAAPAAAQGARPVRFVDLSHTIHDGMVTYKGLPAPLICDHLSREQSRALYAPGTEFQIGRIDMVANTGTYIDAPFHRCADGVDVAGLPLDRIAGLEGTVVRVSDTTERAIDWAHFAAVEVRDRAVLVSTGWDRHWGTDRYFEGHRWQHPARPHHPPWRRDSDCRPPDVPRQSSRQWIPLHGRAPEGSRHGHLPGAGPCGDRNRLNGAGTPINRAPESPIHAAPPDAPARAAATLRHWRSRRSRPVHALRRN